VKAATGKTVSEYASEKLWQPIGAQHPAYWTLDREGGDEKAFCCINSNARDFARFGRLYLHHGNWNGQQLVDSGFVAESVKAAPLTDFDGGPNERYGFHWWVMDYNNNPVFYARGILGQYVTVIPAEQTIVVRLGKKRELVKGDKHPQDLMVYLDAVEQMYW
ncbi:MAG: serine hydrolase, partial [Bacteroidota bacterium]